MFNKITLVLFFTLSIQSCIITPSAFKAEEQPAAPDYSNEKNWCALPFRKDYADIIPKSETWTNDSLKKVDVFYVYPTLYLYGKTWNANLKNKQLNKYIDKYLLQYQATAFNQVGRIYSPRYRQARITSYLDTTGSGEKALDFAYEDVKKAFQYYLKHYNHNRPIIIASHSQGTTHCRKLIKEFFDTPEKKKQLVCAYIIGYEVDSTTYEVLTPCKDAKETNCFLTWSSFKYTFEGTGLKSHTRNKMSVNPITWKMDTTLAYGEGGILFNLNRKQHYKSEVHVSENNLWVKTNAPFFKRIRNLHALDYNLFWFDIRKNAALRVETYFK